VLSHDLIGIWIKEELDNKASTCSLTIKMFGMDALGRIKEELVHFY